VGSEYPNNVLVAQITFFLNAGIFFLFKNKTSLKEKEKKSVKENGVFWNIRGIFWGMISLLVKNLDCYENKLGQDSFLGKCLKFVYCVF
jgi:hypothetical protein